MGGTSWEGIPYSKPYGFEPQKTKEVINRYKDTLEKTKTVIANLQAIILQKDQEIKQMEGELRRMTLEMTMMQVPSMEQVTQRQILSEFKDAHLRGDIKPQEMVTIDMPQNMQVEIDDMDMSVFDDLLANKRGNFTENIPEEQETENENVLKTEEVQIEEPKPEKKRLFFNGLKIKSIKGG